MIEIIIGSFGLAIFAAIIIAIIKFFVTGQPRRIANAVKRGAQSSCGVIKEHVSGEKPLADQDREFYTKAGSEIATKSYDQALFTKAFSESDGDENKAKAIYIRYRVAELRHKRKDRQAMDARDKDGRTPLLLAAIAGELDVVKVLVDNGADVNARDNVGTMPLMWAAFMGELEVIKFLMDKGADVNAKDKDGRTPLIFAKSEGHPDVVKFLKQHGAKE